MQLEQIFSNVADQDKGRELELVDPFEGKPTGVKLWIVGPDSDTARRASLRLADELAEYADISGRVSAEHREKARLSCLAAHVLRWNAEEEGKAVPFSTANLLRILRVSWVAAQVDAFAADRSNFKPTTA